MTISIFMKTYVPFFAAAILLASCGNGGSSGGSDTTTASSDNTSTAENGDLSSNPDYQKGLDLVGASDCLTCHKTSEKLVGPSYQDVANKYAGVDTAVKYLASRIINGVGTNDKKDWGSETNDAVMTPHPQVSQADAEQMVKYVLLLKTK
jgi:cytochrome c